MYYILILIPTGDTLIYDLFFPYLTEKKYVTHIGKSLIKFFN